MVDIFLYDLKEINPEKHKQFTGHSNQMILENLEWLVSQIAQNHNQEIWIRTPIIPRYTATEENVAGIGDFIVNRLNNQINRWDLLAFNNLAASKYERMDLSWDLSEDPLLTDEEMKFFYKIAQQTGAKNVFWSGMTKKEKIGKDSNEPKIKT